MTILERDKDDFEANIRTDAISNRYVVGATIARGKFGVVKKLTDRVTGAEYAGKFVKRGDVQREARLLHECTAHPYIIGLEAFYSTPKMEMVIVMELALRGDIFEYCVGKSPFSESDAREMTRQLTAALQFIHKRHIVHMDIKPQNILLSDDGKCRLADFGLSRKIPPGELVQEISGTPEYTAPEILDYSPITCAADMWSLGCVIYVMLTGFSPFAGDDLQETYLNVSQVNLTFEDDEWEGKSKEPIELIESLCTRLPSERLNASQTLEHLWLKNSSGPEMEMIPKWTPKLFQTSQKSQTSQITITTIEADKMEAQATTEIIRRRRRRPRKQTEEPEKLTSGQSGDSDSGVSVSDEDSFNQKSPQKSDFFKRRELRRKIYQLKMKSAMSEPVASS